MKNNAMNRYQGSKDYIVSGALENSVNIAIALKKPLLIKGRFKGSIASGGDVYINTGAVVDAKIDAGQVWLKGSVTGEIKTTRKLELFSGSSMDGNISTPELVIQSGCRFHGHCDMPVRPKKNEESKNEN